MSNLIFLSLFKNDSLNNLTDTFVNHMGGEEIQSESDNEEELIHHSLGGGNRPRNCNSGVFNTINSTTMSTDFKNMRRFDSKLEIVLDEQNVTGQCFHFCLLVWFYFFFQIEDILHA